MWNDGLLVIVSKQFVVLHISLFIQILFTQYEAPVAKSVMPQIIGQFGIHKTIALSFLTFRHIVKMFHVKIIDLKEI
jgi:hypothetical protein